LVDPAVDRYLRRGFSSLMVCFGCTGGQHRSVYAAQHTAEHIATRPGVRVLLEHREQGIKRLLTATSE
jgi:RNase adaptor protein for sRNA GlmZ degradation